MIKRLLLPVSFVSASAAILFACGSSNSNSTSTAPTPDSGPTTDSSVINTNPDGASPTPDAGADTGDQSSLPEGGVAPQGTLLVPSDTVVVDGITTGGLLIYTDTNASKIYSMPLAGGASTLIAPVDGDNDVLVLGELVVFQQTSSDGVGPISVWKSGGTVTALSTKSFLGQGFVAASSDNSSIFLLENVPASFATADVVIEHTDGSNKTTVVAGIDLQSQTCQPTFRFGGTTGFAAYCPPVGTTDGGTADAGAGSTAVATVTAFAGATFTATTIATNVQPFLAVNATGTEVLVAPPTGLAVYPGTGGDPTTIDPQGLNGAFTKDGLSILYTTSTNELRRATTTAPTPVTLASKDFSFLLAGSPDGNWAIGGLNSTQSGSDLYLSSTSATGAPHTPFVLSSATTSNAGGFNGDAFTADSSNAIYFTSLDPSTGAGTVSAVPTGGTDIPVPLSTNHAFFGYATSGAKYVFGDNLTGDTNTPSRLDIRTVTVTDASTLATVASQADESFFVSADKKTLAYSWSYSPGSMAGIWAYTLP